MDKNLDALKAVYAALGGSPNAVKGDKLLAGVIEKIAERVPAIEAANGVYYVDFTVKNDVLSYDSKSPIADIMHYLEGGRIVVARITLQGADENLVIFAPLVLMDAENGDAIFQATVETNYYRLRGSGNGSTESWTFIKGEYAVAE